MSLESIVLCPPCLSLSLLEEAVSSHPPPLAFASERRVHLSIRRDLSRWEGLLLVLSSRRSFRGSARHRVAASPRTMRAGGGTGRAASFGWQTPCPGRTHLDSTVRRSDSRASAGPAWACPTSADIFSAWTIYVPNSGCLDRVAQLQFNVRHVKGLRNVSDYFTKSLPAIRHKILAPFIASDLSTAHLIPRF